MSNEYTVKGLGFYTEAECERIKEKCETDFVKVGWSKYGNDKCRIFLYSPRKDATEEELNTEFLREALRLLITYKLF